MSLAKERTPRSGASPQVTPLGGAPSEQQEEKARTLKLVKKKKKRVTMDLPELAAETLSAYAEHTGRSKTEFVRAAIGVFANLCDEIIEGNRVLVTGPDGKTLIKELILPS